MTIELERSGVTTPDGVRLNVETTGPVDAPVTVLLVHGWTCSTRSWHNQVEDLPRILGPDAVRVVSYDHRGHGRSDAAPPGSMRIEQLADDLVTVLDTVVGDGPVVYAGHSMGGMTLMALADAAPRPLRFPDPGRRPGQHIVRSHRGGRLRHPQTSRPRNRGGRSPRDEPGQRPDRTPRTPRSRQAGRSPALASRALAARLQRPALRQLVFGKKVDPAEVDLFLADLAVVPGPSYGGFFEAILQHERSHALKVLDQVPVEIMHGTRDRLLPPRHANRMAAELPTARLWMYPGAGHMLMQERPRDVTHRLASLARKASA